MHQKSQQWWYELNLRSQLGRYSPRALSTLEEKKQQEKGKKRLMLKQQTSQPDINTQLGFASLLQSAFLSWEGAIYMGFLKLSPQLKINPTNSTAGVKSLKSDVGKMDVNLIAGGQMINWAFNPRYFYTV